MHTLRKQQIRAILLQFVTTAVHLRCATVSSGNRSRGNLLQAQPVPRRAAPALFIAVQAAAPAAQAATPAAASAAAVTDDTAMAAAAAACARRVRWLWHMWHEAWLRWRHFCQQRWRGSR